MSKKHNIMRISGWLPVSYAIYMTFERQIGKDCYDMAKFVADKLNDEPKYTNNKFIKVFSKNLLIDETKCINGEIQYIAFVNLLIDFIRDSYIIYNDIIKEDQEWKGL